MLRNWCEWDVMVISLRRPVDRSLLHVGKCIQIRCLAIFSSLLEVFPFYRFHQMRSKPMISRMSLSLVVKIGTGHKDHNVSYFLFTSFHEIALDWNISKEIALDRSAWRLAINVSEL